MACPPGVEYDLVIRNCTIYDGEGGEPFSGDVAIAGDRIAAIGDLSGARGKSELNAGGLAVAPGFINMLSWANESLIHDGLSQSDIRQGVTLEVLGEGWSMGPLNDAMKQENLKEQVDIRYNIEWTTLGEYLEHLVGRGISCNVASFVGATTARIYAIGYDDRPPTAEELELMKTLVREAMEEGAVGLSTALEYVPAIFSETEEIVELAKVVSEYGGIYISHIRDEGDGVIEALDELVRIAREAHIRSEIYHLKVSGAANWHLLDDLLDGIEAARREGLPITADMYTYVAGASMLSASLPPWALEGGAEATLARLKDSGTRARIVAQLRDEEWEGFYRESGPDKMMLVGFKKDELKLLTGKTLAQVAEERGVSPEDAMIDLLIEDESPIGTIYFLMNEEQVSRKIAKSWVSFGSDEASLAPEGVFLESNPHPRAYGNVARLLGKYVRDEKVITLQEAVRRLTSLPATNLKLRDRGALKQGFYADVVVFDPAKVRDHATFEEPHQYSTGVLHVFVNGVHVLKNGEHTGATPGRVVRGPGWIGWHDKD